MKTVLKHAGVAVMAIMLLAGCQTPENNAKLQVSHAQLQSLSTIFVPRFDGDPNYSEDSTAAFAQALENALAEKGVTGIRVVLGQPRALDGQGGLQSVVSGKTYSTHDNGFFRGYSIIGLSEVGSEKSLVSISRPSKTKRGDSRRAVLLEAARLGAMDLAAAIAGERMDK